MNKEKEDVAKQNKKLKQNLEDSKKKIKSLKEENLKLNAELNRIKLFVDKFINSSNKLNLLLNNQQAVFIKSSLGFNKAFK